MNRDPLRKYFGAADRAKSVSDSSLDDRVRTKDLLARLRNTVEIEPNRRYFFRFWHRSTVISIVAVLAIAGSAAALTFFHSSVADTSRLSCYSQVSLTSHAIDEIPLSSHPLGSCSSALGWKRVAGSSSPNGSLCVLPNGSLAAFPPSKKSDVCALLKLPTYNGRLVSTNVADFEKNVVIFFGAKSCISPASARSEVLRLFRRYDLTHWSVRITRMTSDNACATLAIQVKSRVVELVGLLK